MSQMSSIASAAYTGQFSPLEESNNLEREWRALEATSNCSFFITWSWIGTWLQLARNRTKLFVYRCYQKDEVIALAIISIDTINRRYFFRSTMLALNESCLSDLDMFIEYNGLLARKGHELAALNQLVVDLADNRPEWDEFQLTNIPTEICSSLQNFEPRLKIIIDTELGIWAAPLNKDTTTDSILSGLKKKRRWQLRRSFKEYEKEGELHIDAANSLDKARHYFLQMGEFHTRRWNRAGKVGSFAKYEWVKFHLALIENNYGRGEIQMLRIRCGERIIGFIYNFIWQNSILMLQSGFTIENRNLLRPGYISHLLAMQHNAQLGATQYNFLAGESDYKRVLAIAYPPLVSVRLQRRQVKFLIEDALLGTRKLVKCAREISRVISKKDHLQFLPGTLPKKADFDFALNIT